MNEQYKTTAPWLPVAMLTFTKPNDDSHIFSPYYVRVSTRSGLDRSRTNDDLKTSYFKTNIPDTQHAGGTEYLKIHRLSFSAAFSFSIWILTCPTQAQRNGEDDS